MTFASRALRNVAVTVVLVAGLAWVERLYDLALRDASFLSGWLLDQLKDDAAVPGAISSGEAERARQDWERWMPHVSELSVEIYAGLGPLPPYHHWN